ncbi:T-lymphocyte surface antigen Ly-9-like [Mobula hypostoma]|uniref:T-lymphocyte surface antigen Ly-9-like n=1 Tax=Mobula hypostoma TaxID=723540 RepID=UPI002FC35EED
MWKFSIRMVPSLLSVVICAIYVAGTGASGTTVYTIPGKRVTLLSGITAGPHIAEVEWKRSSPRTTLVRYSKTNTKYFESIYTGRIKLNLSNFNLEILDLWKNDTGDFEVIFTKDNSGLENRKLIRLEVYELVSGANIVVQNCTGTCNLKLTCSVTSGDAISFTWQREGEIVGNDSTHQLGGLGETLLVRQTAEAKDVPYNCEVGNPLNTVVAGIKLERHACKLRSSDTVPDKITTPCTAAHSTTKTDGKINNMSGDGSKVRERNTAMPLVPQKMSLLVGLAVMVTLLISLSL